MQNKIFQNNGKGRNVWDIQDILHLRSFAPISCIPSDDISKHSEQEFRFHTDFKVANVCKLWQKVLNFAFEMNYY